MGKRGFWRWIAGGLIGLVLAGAVAGYILVGPYARIGGTYLAKQICSCVFVVGRSDASCRAEFEPDIEKFQVNIHHGGMTDRSTVNARLFIFTGAAKYTDGYGCTVTK